MHRTKHLSTTFSLPITETQPTKKAKASSVSGPPSRPNMEDQDGAPTDPGRSASHDVSLAYYNAMLHHFGLCAYSVPSDVIEDERILEVLEEDLDKKDLIAKDSADVPVADGKIPQKI